MKRAIKTITVITLLFIGCKNNADTFNTVIETKKDLTSRVITDSNAIITNTSKNERVRATIKHTLYHTNSDTVYATSTTVIELNAGEQVTKPCKDLFGTWKITHEIVGETIIK
jgi:hypothetical protein